MDLMESAFWEAILENPGDATPKLVFADWLLDQERPALAHCLQWCARRRRHPRPTPQRRKWSWRRAWDDRLPLPGQWTERLPILAYVAITPSSAPQRHRYKTMIHAFNALAEALADLKEAYAWPT